MWLKRFIASLTLGVVVLPAMAEMPKEINFGIISTDSSAALRSRWQPVLDEMQARVGTKVNAFFATDYAGVIEAMRFKKVDIAWFGNKSAIEAVDRANGEVFVQTLAEDGAGYYSVLITHRDSSFKTFDDVLKRGKEINFGIGDPNSTSGFLVPTTFIFSAKSIDPKVCFKTVRAANHEANALAVANKLVHAATNNSENMERLEKTAPAAHANIRIIWTSPLIPSDPLVWRKDLDAGLKKTIGDWLFAYGRTDAEKKVLADLQWAPFKKSDNNQLLPIRQMELNKEIMKLKGDEKLAATEKTAKLAELEKQFADIGRQIDARKQ